MNIKNKRENTKEYLKEFYKAIPKRTTVFSRNTVVDISKLDNIKDKIEMFYEKEILISPTLIDKESITNYIDTLNSIKQFPENLKPDVISENIILSRTQNKNNTRRILIPSIVEENSDLLEEYDRMIAYYLTMDGDNPIERFSKVGMSMKQYGISTDIGVSIMKNGDRLTTKLEELATNKNKSSKEWECFKDQVLHTFSVAEKIGNRQVNKEEHIKWEERLIKLGILERKVELNKVQENTFKKELSDLANNSGKNENDPSTSKVKTDIALQKNAQQIYIRTGMIPVGYKKDENGKIVKIEPKIQIDERKNRLSASKENLSSSEKNKKQITR